MLRSILAPFKKFSPEGATVGRLLAGYSNLEVDLMHCVSMGRGGDLDTVLKAMFGKRGEERRIKEAEKLGQAAYLALNLGADFRRAIKALRNCLKMRNQYAHWVWWDDYSGKLAFANLENLAERRRKVNDLRKLRPLHVDAALLDQQEAYFVYADEYLAWINYEGRHRAGKMAVQPLGKPKLLKRPPLYLP